MPDLASDCAPRTASPMLVVSTTTSFVVCTVSHLMNVRGSVPRNAAYAMQKVAHQVR